MYEEYTYIAHTRNLSIQRIQKTIYMYFKDLKAYSIQIVLLLSLKFLLPFYMKNDYLVPSMHNTLKETHFQVMSSIQKLQISFHLKSVSLMSLQFQLVLSNS